MDGIVRLRVYREETFSPILATFSDIGPKPRCEAEVNATDADRKLFVKERM